MQTNQDKNQLHYESKYSGYSVENTLYWLQHLEEFLAAATSTETSWHGMYLDNFKYRLKGKKVLELGCGDCTNAGVMAALGAEVYANDIASSSGEIINKLNDNHKFPRPIKFIAGDFLQTTLPSQTFDFVIGKAFLHHLEISVERKFLKETARVLKHDGEARFFEPAVNSKWLDEIRWYMPVPGRPSKMSRAAFKKWKESDPHPDRSFNSKHFETAGKFLFETVKICPVGTLERFHRILPKNQYNGNFRKWALKQEQHLPKYLNRTFARSQLIIYQYPRI